jgi:hypothetical protein
VTSEDYAYWCGRLSVALREILDNPGDAKPRLLGIAVLDAYQVANDDPRWLLSPLAGEPGGEVIEIEGHRTRELPYPAGPLASRRVDVD